MEDARKLVSAYAGNAFLPYEALTQLVRAMAATYPDLCRLESIATSAEGRSVWALTISSPGDAGGRPAVLLEANIHAGEITSTAAALFTAKRLLEGYGADPAVTRLLAESTIYLVPCLAVDGYEHTLVEGEFLRSSPLPYPDPTLPTDGLKLTDVDGDGKIQMMRQRHPLGEWKVSALDPRIMVRRGPEDLEGDFYRLYPEAMLLQPEGRELQVFGPFKAGQKLDFNRNFPAGWQPEHKQMGAGRYPLDQVETRALVDFILAHPNINVYLALHTYGGVLLRPPTAGGDDTMNQGDLRLFEAIGELCQRVTGYPCKSSHFAFTMLPGQVLTRTSKDWAYEHLGLLGYTMELWDPDARAGAKGYRDIGMKGMLRMGEAEREQDELKRLQWLDKELNGEGFKVWTPFEHPQLGPVEIGGWDLRFVRGNAPLKFLPEVCQGVADFTVKLGHTLPRLQFGKVRATRLEGGTWRVEAEVCNGGFMSTATTRVGADIRAAKPVEVGLTLPAGAVLLAGKAKQELGHLDGYSAAQADPFGGNMVAGARLAAWAEWVVAAPAETELVITAACPRAGSVETRVQLV